MGHECHSLPKKLIKTLLERIELSNKRIHALDLLKFVSNVRQCTVLFGKFIGTFNVLLNSVLQKKVTHSVKGIVSRDEYFFEGVK